MSGRLHTSGNGASGEGMHSRPHANIAVLTTRGRALLDVIDANENRRLDEVVSDLQDVVAALRSFFPPRPFSFFAKKHRKDRPQLLGIVQRPTPESAKSASHSGRGPRAISSL